jgi:hypothetical protein
MRPWIAVACLLGSLVVAAPAQDEQSEIDRLMTEGMADALETRIGTTGRPAHLHALARAWANQARRTREASRRTRAYEKSAQRYTDWIDALERADNDEPRVIRQVRIGAAQVELAGVILSGQAGAELDTFEITAGERGDRVALRKWLDQAAALYKAAAGALPRTSELTGVEEESLLAIGLYDALRQAELDLQYHQAWVHYHQGVFTENDAEAEARHFTLAERQFQELLQTEQAGQMTGLCYLGRAMAQREQRAFSRAERSFQEALETEVNEAARARVRYELARSRLADKRYQAAREALAPLVALDPDRLKNAQQPARFYINLAHVWDAYSYLVESNAVRAAALGSAAEKAQRQKARRLREKGLAKLQRLSDRGGPWPAVVQIYIARGVNLKTPLRQLTPLELYLTGTVEIGLGRYESALERLETVLARPDVPRELVADSLFEIGRCQYQLRRYDDAATAFTTLATEHRQHPRAAQATTFAYQLWAKVAERSASVEDYTRLAEVLRLLLETYGDHPERDEAAWLLPVALQAAGDYETAARQFAKVPAGTKHWEEAQFRALTCRRLTLQAAQDTTEADAYAQQARELSEQLLQYAADAARRSTQSVQPDQLMDWAAQACIVAGDLLVADPVAAHADVLKALADFERRFPKSERRTAVLNLRIRAHCGLRQFGQAADLLKAYLQTTSSAEAGPTLATLASGMQAELQRLLEAGDAAEAAALARASVETFEELESWVRADESRRASLRYVLLGRARMLYHAGRHAEALKIVETQLEQQPRNGNFQHLRAAILEAQLNDNADEAAVTAARSAWAALLSDPALRQQMPERYWEARYHWLALTLRLGQAADVARQISQEQILYPDLGGPPWQARLKELLEQARAKAPSP